MIADETQRTLGQKIFRDCATFMLAYGFAKGRKDAAVDVIQLPCSEDEKRPWQLAKPARSLAANRKTMDSVRSYIQTA